MFDIKCVVLEMWHFKDGTWQDNSSEQHDLELKTILMIGWHAVSGS